MLVPVTRVLICLALCLVLLSSWGCPSDGCVEYQDIARISIMSHIDLIDSVVMIANDSIIGCGGLTSKVIGSKTHHVRFPINVRLQFFSRGDLWKEFFFEMNKNTVVYIYTGFGSSDSMDISEFLREVELAKEKNLFIDSSLTDDYCWLLRKMGRSPSYDDIRCIEWAVDGKQNLCSKPYFK